MEVHAFMALASCSRLGHKLVQSAALPCHETTTNYKPCKLLPRSSVSEAMPAMSHCDSTCEIEVFI